MAALVGAGAIGVDLGHRSLKDARRRDQGRRRRRQGYRGV
jgi:hypothetical protein